MANLEPLRSVDQETLSYDKDFMQGESIMTGDTYGLDILPHDQAIESLENDTFPKLGAIRYGEVGSIYDIDYAQYVLPSPFYYTLD